MITVAKWESVKESKVKAIVVLPMININKAVVNHQVKIFIEGDEAYRTYFIVKIPVKLDPNVYVGKTIQEVHDSLKAIDDSFSKLDDLLTPTKDTSDD